MTALGGQHEGVLVLALGRAGSWQLLGTQPPGTGVVLPASLPYPATLPTTLGLSPTPMRQVPLPAVVKHGTAAGRQLCHPRQLLFLHKHPRQGGNCKGKQFVIHCHCPVLCSALLTVGFSYLASTLAVLTPLMTQGRDCAPVPLHSGPYRAAGCSSPELELPQSLCQ